MFENMFKKFKIKVGNCLCPIKKVDNVAINFNLDPINVLNSEKLLNFNFNSDQIRQSPGLLVFQSSGLCLLSLFFRHIVHPQCCKSQILEDLTENVIIGPTIAL